MASQAGPSGRAGAVERSADVVRVASAAVETRRRGANVVHDLAVGAGETFRTHAHVLVGVLVNTSSSVLARFVSPARI